VLRAHVLLLPLGDAERLDHANAVLTLNVYAHLWQDDEDRTREAVDEALKSASAVPSMYPRVGP
jgi:hypothetical protein